jgi:hypothetical protein
MGEWHEFKVKGQKLSLLNLLDKVVSMSDRYPLRSNLLSIAAGQSTSTASRERDFSVMNW